MGRTGALKHAHRYEKTYPYGNNQVIWRCTLDGCTHFIPLGHPIIGRKNQCWKCSRIFQIEERHLTQMKLCCDICSGYKTKGDDLEEQMEINMRASHDYTCSVWVHERCDCAKGKAIDEEKRKQKAKELEGYEEYWDDTQEKVVRKKRGGDEIEVYYPIAEVQSIIPVGEHAPDCMAWFGESCDCGLE